MATYINKYTAHDGHDAKYWYGQDSSARATLGKSTVSLEDDSGVLHYDGVNVEVKRPKVGDAVYVPTTSMYSAATPGSSVSSGTVTFISGGTVKDSLMSAKGLTAIGTVVSVTGSKCYVMYKYIASPETFYAGAVGGDGGIPAYRISDDDLGRLSASNVMDSRGVVGFRCCVSDNVLYAFLTGRGGAGKDEGWDGGSDGVDNVFLNGADWGLALGPGAASVTAHDPIVYKVQDTVAEFGADESGFKKYLASRKAMYTSRYTDNVVLVRDGKESTGLLADANVESDLSYFIPAQFGYNHSKTWNSYGNFANIDGLRRGDWFMPGIGIIQDIFGRVTYTLESTPTDVVNATQRAIGGSELKLNSSSNDGRYWLPFVSTRTTAWYLSRQGCIVGSSGIYSGNMDESCRTLSIALLNINH